MEGEEERSNIEGSFSSASIPKRIAIVIAGGMVNIIFGLLVYFFIAFNAGNNISLIVNNTIENYCADIYGIEPGDEILEIEGKRIRTKTELDSVMSKANGNEIVIKIRRNNEIIQYKVKPTESKIKSTGIYLSSSNKKSGSKIVQIEKDSSAEKAGLNINDNILKINGEDVENNQEKIIQIINQNDINEFIFTIERNGKEYSINVIPEYIESYNLGVELKKAEDNFTNNLYYGFLKTVNFGKSIVENVKQLFTGKVKIDQMMGPVGLSSAVSETKGTVEFMYVVAVISVSLGITNLLPIPALDGGKVLILLIEAIRRKPMKENIEIAIQNIGFFVLIALSILVTYNDILKTF